MIHATDVDCAQVMEELWAYLDGELSADRMAEIDAHLEKCAPCFSEYDFRHAFLTFLRRNREVPVPAGLRRELFERILEVDSNGNGHRRVGVLDRIKRIFPRPRS
ncbi:MAG: zf-HC2 domain-containing protein [Longimicrobiaceae bacterium]